MPHHLRYQSKEWATHHVTSRCAQGRSLLTPTSEINATIRGVLCYSLDKHKDTIKIHCHSFLSNHFHLLISAKQTKDLAKFMCHFKGNLARELARVHDWRGPFWEKRYSSEEILDLEAYKEIFKYIIQNSVKEGLVWHPREWAGLHAYHQIVEGQALRGGRLNRTRLYQAQVRAQASGLASEDVNERDFIIDYEVELTHPPMWHKSAEVYRSLSLRLCEEAIEEARAKRDSSRPVMGMTQVLNQDIYAPRSMERSSRPLCRTTCVERLRAFKRAYFNFKVRFQEASAALRELIALGVPLNTGEGMICFPAEGIPLFGGRGFESIARESPT